MSGGIDSGAVTTTAARLLAGSDRRIVAFTAVPREGYSAPVPRNRIADEGPRRPAVAARHPNIDHILVRSDQSPLDDLDRSFLFLERPALNICNGVWVNAIHDAMRDRGLTVALCGTMGNMGLSYSGLQLLPELIRQGRWLRWWREAGGLVRSDRGRMRWRGVLANSLGPWCPVLIWTWLNHAASGYAHDVGDYSAINPARLGDIDLPARAGARALDLAYRPWKDAFAMRLWVLRRVDQGAYAKGILGGWRVDWRDPTADIRLLEFCLNVPTEQYLQHGVPRSLARQALADRMPSLVLDEPRKGLQAADWHERLTEVRDRVADEIDRLEACPAAVRALDLPRLRRLVDHWPRHGWERPEVYMPYRYALLRAISAGHFLRRVAGGNA